MNHIELLNEFIKKNNYQSVTYQNISIPNGWVVECKLFNKLNGPSYSSISYNEDINLATKEAAMLVYNQINRVEIKQSKTNQKRTITIDDPLPPRPKVKDINIVEYEIKKQLLDDELADYTKQRLGEYKRNGIVDKKLNETEYYKLFDKQLADHMESLI